jgi:acetyl-CoA carboxylase biotin carboxyl carrier protein
VVSPSDGVFYRKPSPDAPAFVEVGASVSAGQAVGLVEVMKTFNQILYGGPGFPEPATVVEIRADDTAEVRAGQVLLVVSQR